MGAAATNLAIVELEDDALDVDLRTRQRAAYTRHAPAIIRRLWHLCGDLHRAEDLAQESFVIAFDRWAECRNEDTRLAWLHGIAFNQLRGHRRKHARRTRLLETHCHVGRELPAQGESTSSSDASTQHQLVCQLQVLLAELPTKLRDAFVLRVIEGLSLQACAKCLNVSVATVSQRASAAEAVIREQMELRA